MPDPRPISGPERDQLAAYLDSQRAALLRKTEGLTAEQLAAVHPPSTLTLGALLNHGALNEDWWFSVQFAGNPQAEHWTVGADWEADPDWEMSSAAADSPEALRERYEAACAHSRDIVARAESLDVRSAALSGKGETFDLRWIVLHMIEETARHAGHADLIRESIDGATGE
jgi:hypothetical protein